MRIKNILYITLCISLFCISGCKTKEKTDNSSDKEVSKQKGESFESFYTKFMADKNFQLSRVTFPLECIVSDGETETTIMYEKDWQPFVVPIDKVDTKIYKVEKKVTPTEVTHRIYIENSDTDILIKYRLIKGKWYLVYYRSIML